MQEVFPIAAGAIIGLTVSAMMPQRLRWIALFAFSIVVGVLASTISGELALSWGFVPVDIVQALVGAVGVRCLIPIVRQVRSRRHPPVVRP